jgi:hypothetical protein
MIKMMINVGWLQRRYIHGKTIAAIIDKFYGLMIKDNYKTKSR